MQQQGYIIFNERNKNQQKLNQPDKRRQRRRSFSDDHLVSPPLIRDVSGEMEENDEERLQTLTNSSDTFEFCITAHWIFELFPNKVVIDIHKISFIDRTFLFKNVTSILIKDIAKVEVSNDYLFATLEVINVTETISLQIKHLRKDDARNALAIIQGLMVAYKNDIDIAKLNPKEILDELMKLGSPVT